jgi:hypothetical protein
MFSAIMLLQRTIILGKIIHQILFSVKVLHKNYIQPVLSLIDKYQQDISAIHIYAHNLSHAPAGRGHTGG